MASAHIFFDATGRRRKIITVAGGIGAAAVAVAVVLFALSVFSAPRASAVEGRAKVAPHSTETHAKKPKATVNPPAAPEPDAPRIVAAFFTSWQEDGVSSFRRNADKLTHMMPEWLHLDSAGRDLERPESDPRTVSQNLDLIRIAREHRVAIQPILNNAVETGFDPERAHRLLASGEAQGALAARVRDWLLERNFDGVNLDFENLADGDAESFAGFVEVLGKTLHDAGLKLSVDLEVDYDDPALVKRVAAASDFVVVMAYDEHSDADEPGPVASQEWFSEVVLHAVARIPRDKLVFGIGNYGYDWGAKKPGESISFQTTMIRAREHADGREPKDFIRFDATAQNPTFTYRDAEKQAHEVWFLDAVTASNQWQLVREAGARGGALWVLGSEDPGVWTFLDRRLAANPPELPSLDAFAFHDAVAFFGEGEILSVRTEEVDGARTATPSAMTGLYYGEQYDTLASPALIDRSCRRADVLALTFDDGPDPVFTPQILDCLDRLHAPGAFFLVGERAGENPALVRDIYGRGHDIGNHSFTHPNMARVSPERARLEINSTQRLLQGAIGHSTTLFRPPFFSDAKPDEREAIDPVLLAAREGYVTVGELIDPQDWRLADKGEGGRETARSAADIAADILAQVHSGRGGIILLHDGGGDRTRTVAALETAVPALRREGFRFVSVSELLGKSRDQVMPAVAPTDAGIVRVDGAVFGSTYLLLRWLRGAFVAAIFLGTLRVVFVTALALVGARRRVVPPAHQPSVTVLLAAYNECTVISRTLQSILRNDYPIDEIIVIDDGSTDGTARAVREEFGGNPRVRLICQPNAGKAAALNRGLAAATGELLVCADADTQFAPDAIRLLVQRFGNPRVGAVAGNVKVGNLTNLLTRWQSIEYITSQNIDRLASATLDAVAVVPGAIGAWRRRAVLDVGGYREDTLAEDMDLTWRLHRSGWRIETENHAVAFTEAPDTMRAFFKQRFRWGFGTLQCLWKHRGALGRHGWFGWLTMPSQWVFQIFFQLLAPLVDLQVAITLGLFCDHWVRRKLTHTAGVAHAGMAGDLTLVLSLYLLFFGLELFAAVVAVRLDRGKFRGLWCLVFQRVVYRQMLYLVMLKAILRALTGSRMTWGKLDRKGTVGWEEPALST